MKKLKNKQIETTTWETQAEKVQAPNKANVDFCLPKFSATKIVSWKCHVDKKTNIRYDMILGRDLINALGLDLKFYEDLIIGGEGEYEGCSETMDDLSNHDFKSLMEK